MRQCDKPPIPFRSPSLASFSFTAPLQSNPSPSQNVMSKNPDRMSMNIRNACRRCVGSVSISILPSQKILTHDFDRVPLANDSIVYDMTRSSGGRSFDCLQQKMLRVSTDIWNACLFVMQPFPHAGFNLLDSAGQPEGARICACVR